MQRNKLLIFVKNEEAGKVKTRLAASVGDEEALKVYKKLLMHTVSITVPLKLQKEVWYSRFIPEKDIWSKDLFTKRVQKGKDLGERMSHAFDESFRNGYNKVVIIGSDCAELSSDIIREAFNALERLEFVIGPAEDGGYYLLGMCSYHPALFKEVNWSTDSVFRETLNKIKSVEGSVHLLRTLNDVDTLDDWKQNKAKI